MIERMIQMQIRNVNGGYSKEEYNRQTSGVIPQILIGSGARKKYSYDDEKKTYTDTISSVEIDAYYPGLGVQVIKMPGDFKIPKGLEDLSEIELIDPEACVVSRKLYVKAKGIK